MQSHKPWLFEAGGGAGIDNAPALLQNNLDIRLLSKKLMEYASRSDLRKYGTQMIQAIEEGRMQDAFKVVVQQQRDARGDNTHLVKVQSVLD